MPNRLDRLKERLADTKFAERIESIESILRGKEPLRAGVPVAVERATKAAPNGKEFHIKIAASTDGIARDGGIVPMTAWERGGLKNFNRNPVILAYHSHRDPIGISVHTEIDNRDLVEHWLFHEKTELSRTMKSLYEEGFMRAASIGFLVEEFRFVDELSEDEIESLYKKYGKAALKDVYWIAEKAELLETSAVPVPSDPNALAFSFAARNAEAHGIDISDLKRLRGDTMPTTVDTSAAVVAPVEGAAAVATDKREDVAAPATTDKNVDLRALLSEGLDKINKEIKALSERMDKVEKSAKPADPVVETEVAAGERSLEISIEKLDGESDADAVSRVAERIAREKLGMPVPAKK